MSKWISFLLGLGVSLLFVARQVLSEGTTQSVVTWLATAAILGALVWRITRLGSAGAAQKPVEGILLLAYGGVFVALGLYVMSTEWGLTLLGLNGNTESRIPAVLAVLWPVVFVAAGGALKFMELAYARMPVAQAVEIRRIRSAGLDGLTIALSMVFVLGVNYATAKQDVRKDMSYFKTTRPSEGTLDMVEALGEPIEIVLFFPKANEVLSQLKPYFAAVDKASSHVEFRVRDHALAPKLTRKHQIRENGTIALFKGEGDSQQVEKFAVGTDLEEARSKLRTLDGRFQESFMKLTRQRRELHLTIGHDERSRTGVEGDGPELRISELRTLLERSNITTRELGLTQGLGNDVPKGIPLVSVLGPRKPFLPEETQALLRYVQQGGRLVVMVDPDVDHGLTPLFQALGVKLESGVLTSDRYFIRRNFNLSDRTIVRTNNYSAHPTVTMASRNSNQLATIFLRGGALSKYEGEGVLEGSNVVFPVRTVAPCWLDLDGDFQRGETEELKQYNMVAAVSVPVAGKPAEEEGRALIISDGDFVTDQVVRNPGNVLVFGDMLQWMLGEEQIVGETNSEEDVRIEHTKDEDKAWFWITTFGAPLPLFALGLWAGTRRRKRRSGPKSGPGTPPPAQAPVVEGDTEQGVQS